MSAGTDSGKENLKKIASAAALALASARAAGGDFTGLAAEGAKHIKTIAKIIVIAFFIILLPLIMLAFSVSAFNSSGGTTGSGSDNETVVSGGLMGFIERHEGYYATGYRGVDYQNVTIGYGHVIQPGESFTSLSPAQADTLLKKDLSDYETSVDREFAGTKLTQYQHDALVDFAYNLGAYIWPKASRLVFDIKSGASPAVLRDDLTAWDHCNGAEIRGLYNRRIDEWRLFVYGDYACDSADGI